MTVSHTDTRPRRLRPLAGAAVIAWVSLPAGVAVVLALGVRMSSNWPDPAARWAVEAVLLVQIVLSSLIFPRLLGRWIDWLASLALAAAVLAGAMVLSGTPLLGVAMAWVWLAAWLGGLSALAGKGRRGHFLASLPGVVVTGVLVGVYLEAEAGRAWLGHVVPAPVSTSTFPHWPVWTAPAVVWAGWLGSIFLNYFRRG